MTRGPLEGIRIVELGAKGPGPFCAMLLADLGADILRIVRPGSEPNWSRFELINRNRPAVLLDLKSEAGRDVVLRLVDNANALIEGYRPGVCERLGVGPDDCTARNPRLVYGRATGWGQTGPLAVTAGHDINYIALAGALHLVGRAEGPPVPPVNFVGDFGGGMLLAIGMLAALLESRESGIGQSIDAAMVDGAALLSTVYYGRLAAGTWQDARGVNKTDSGAHFYDAYECADGKYLSVGAIEPQFYGQLLRTLEITDEDLLEFQDDPARWPRFKKVVAAAVKRRTLEEWCGLFAGSDSCASPVLSLTEAPLHEHNVARDTFIDVDGVLQPAPAPRFSRTPNATPVLPSEPSSDAMGALRPWGFDQEEVDRLLEAGVLVLPSTQHHHDRQSPPQ